MSTDPLQLFLQITQRTILSPAEYGDYLDWQWDALPDALMCQIIERTLAERPPDRVRGARLGYIRWGVQEQIDAWKRAVGSKCVLTSMHDIPRQMTAIA